MAMDEPDRDEAPRTSAAEPDGLAASGSAPAPEPTAHDQAPESAATDATADNVPPAPGETREQSGDQLAQTLAGVPHDPWAETEVRPVPAELRHDRGGPSGTSIMPPVEDVPGTPRWSARAQVRTPDLGEEDEHVEWAEPPRGLLVPILVSVCILLLVALLGLGSWLVFADRPSATTPVSTPTVQRATPPATSAAQPTTVTTSAAPTPVALPDVRGQDYETAAATLRALGFTPVRRDEINAEVPKGKVVGTDPPAGTPVRPGANINVIVSTGLPPATSPAATPSASAHAS